MTYPRRCAPRGIDRWRPSAVACGAALALAGCMTPIGSPANSPKGAGRTSGSSRGSSYHSTFVSKRPPVDFESIKIGTEKLRPEDIWRGQAEDLAAQSKALADAEFRRYLEQRAAQNIADRVAEMLLYQKASARMGANAEKGIDRFVDSEIRKTVTEDYGGIQRRYEKRLESQGLTFEDAREKIRREVVIAGFLEAEIKPKIGEPTRADLRAAFDADRGSSVRKERRRMSLITLRLLDLLPKDSTEPTREQLLEARQQAGARARAVLEELRGGADFADLARRYSSDLHAADGGDWGWVTQGSVRERFEPAVAALFTGASTGVREIVETPDDFFVVRCDEIEAAEEPTFESAQPLLRSQFVRKAQNRLVGELIVQLREKAHVDVADLERLHAAAVAHAYRLVERANPTSSASPAAGLP